MPRAARKKSADSMYHIMSRSISEIDLYQCEEDKAYYLGLLKRYIEKYHCKIYAYCLMDNHVHFYINTCGFDISIFMRCLNTAYAAYYNKRYSRHGHLFQGRFCSKTVDNDTYSLTLSAYIHNNAKDIAGYDGNEDSYMYSSYGVYTGRRRNAEGIVDDDFLLELFSSDRIKARQKYKSFTQSMRDTGIMRELHEGIMREYTENVYSSGKKYIMRHETPKELIKRIGALLGERLPEMLRAKFSREASRVRAFTAYVMRALCGYTYMDICKYIGNMSVSGVSRLSNEGFRLLGSDMQYCSVFRTLIYPD